MSVRGWKAQALSVVGRTKSDDDPAYVKRAAPASSRMNDETRVAPGTISERERARALRPRTLMRRDDRARPRRRRNGDVQVLAHEFLHRLPL